MRGVWGLEVGHIGLGAAVKTAWMLAIIAVILTGAEPFDKEKAVKAWREKAKANAEKRAPELEDEVKLLTKRLEQAKKGRIVKNLKEPMLRGPKGDYSFREQRKKDSEIKLVDRTIATAKARLAYAKAGGVEEFAMPLQVGAIGRIGSGRAKVLHVIDESSMIIEPRIAKDGIGQSYQVTVLLLAPTTGIADDSVADTGETYIVTGTRKQYGTTYFVLEPIDAKPAKK